MSEYSDEQSRSGHDDKSTKSPDIIGRGVSQTPLASAPGSVAMPSLSGSQTAESKAHGESDDLTIAPRYYPLQRFRPEIDLQGKLAVVTGASRGNGRAVGEALRALGVDVIGTSRNPMGVPNPPSFPLLALDIANPASVFAFRDALQSHGTFRQHGSRVDILVNNAARLVVGQIVPPDSTDFSFYLEQRELALRTLYSGHVLTTNVMLPLMPQHGYARILFTVSVASYFTGASFLFLDLYNAAKAALRVYANNLDTVLRAGGSSKRVSTVNPYTMHTALAEHPNPIYTQPVAGPLGLSPNDLKFNTFITLFRQALANGLPPSMVGETCAQLLRMEDPVQNVVVGSPREPLATKGGNAIIEQLILADNRISAVPFKCESSERSRSDRSPSDVAE